MSLYLCIFNGDEEVTGWVFGHYSDLGHFRDVIKTNLGAADFPTLMQHSDCDGEWSPQELGRLRHELHAIAERFKGLPPDLPVGAFEHTAGLRCGAKSLYDCFHNVDGENVFEALDTLCGEAINRDLPVLFQ